MKSKALIRLVETSAGFHITYLAVEFTVLCYTQGRQEAFTEALVVSQRESEINARRVAGMFGTEGAEVRCPEGRVVVPADSWHCKLTRRHCRLQAFVDTRDHSSFKAGCDAPEKKKNDILKTILAGKYSGFHHVPGRFLCPACADTKKTGNPLSYHYHWETAGLDVALRMDYEEAARRVRTLGASRAYLSGRLCAPCCLRVGRAIAPEESAGLELLEFEIDPR